MNELIQTIAVYALPVIFAITLHESAHAYAARYFGDLTAYQQGRLSLNPMRHLDPFGTVLIPVVLYLATGGNFLFGYAKPVPVNFGNLRKPKRDMAWVALAGPGANFVMALIWVVLGMLLRKFGTNEEFFFRMANAGVATNLVMLAFNLFPVPPLDGGRIVVSLLPHKYAYRYAQMEQYGFFIVMLLVVLKVLQFWMVPVMSLAAILLQYAALPFAFLLGL